MRSKGFISSLLFCEIKTHRTPLLAGAPYRFPDLYQVSKDVVGAVAQVQKTAHKAQRLVSGDMHKHYRDDGAPTDIEFSTARPRQVLVIGSLSEFTDGGAANPEKITSFERYRRSIQDVEVITFDELYQRACFIVEDRCGALDRTKSGAPVNPLAPSGRGVRSGRVLDSVGDLGVVCSVSDGPPRPRPGDPVLVQEVLEGSRWPGRGMLLRSAVGGRRLGGDSYEHVL